MDHTKLGACLDAVEALNKRFDAFAEGDHPRGEGGKFTAAQEKHHGTLTGGGYKHTGFAHSNSGEKNTHATYQHEQGHHAVVGPTGAWRHEKPVDRGGSHEWETKRGKSTEALKETISSAHKNYDPFWAKGHDRFARKEEPNAYEEARQSHSKFLETLYPGKNLKQRGILGKRRR